MESHGKKYITILFLIIILVFIYTMNKINPRTNFYNYTDYFMDTKVTIKVKDRPDVEQKVAEAVKKMKLWAYRLDRFNQNSVISKINNADGKPVKVSKSIFNLLKMAKKYYILSNKAFDPTIAPLMDLWGFGTDSNKVPDSKEIKNVLKRIGFNRIIFDVKKDSFENENYYISLPAGMAVDLGALAKGFIIDKGLESLKKAGFDSIYINAGGNIRVLGEKTADHLWQLGIRKPRGAGIYNKYILGLDRGSLATSGDYERYFTVDGVRYSHLIDPRTGYQAREMQSVTIYAPSALKADMLSTSVFIMGWEKGKELINSLSDVEGFMVNNDHIWYSQGFRNLLSFSEK